MASKKIVSANVVRSWALSTDLSKIEGLPEGYKVGDRGRLHPAIRTAFAAQNKGQAYEVGHKEPKTVTVKATRVSEKGRKTPLVKKVVPSEARNAAIAAGVPNVGERGMPSKAVLTAFALGDFSSLLSAPEAPVTEAPESE